MLPAAPLSSPAAVCKKAAASLLSRGGSAALSRALTTGGAICEFQQQTSSRFLSNTNSVRCLGGTSTTGRHSVVLPSPAMALAATQIKLTGDGRRYDSTGAVHTLNVPSMGDSISEGAISQWNKQIGDYVEADEVICVVDTDKISVDINCPVSGILVSREAEEGDTVFVGSPFYQIELSGDGPPPPKPESETPTAANEAHDGSPEEEMAVPSLREETRVPMSRMRQKIAERLKSAQDNAAALTTFNEVDLTELMAMRSALNESFKATHDVKLGFMSPFIIACARALVKMPDINATLDGTDLIYRNYADISVAVATPTGLMVPVIRDCHTKSFATLEKELIDLATRARKGQISLAEMQGGTFTISNGGVYGSMMGTPLLNPPQSAILGMHSITQRPVVRNGKIEIRPMMYLALTYDHQVVDGREAVTFLNVVKSLLEDPRRLLLDL